MANINELINELAQDTAVVKPARHPAVLSIEWILAAAFYLATALIFFGYRPDLTAKLQETWFLAEIVVLVAIFLTTTLSAALLSFPDMHQMPRFTLIPAISFSIFTMVMLFALQADKPPSPPPDHSFICTMSITLFAILPAIWTFYVMRKLASTHHYRAGSIALLAAFSVGALWLRFYEQNDSILHVIEWHYLPMIVVSFIGMWMGKIFLKW